MVTGSKQEDITAELILSRVSEADIFYRLLGNYKTGEAICNPLRGEQDPSAIIREKDGKLRMTDYGSSRYNGDCFDIWSAHFGLSYDETLKDIYRVFQLQGNVRSPIVTWEAPKIVVPKPPPLIQWTYRRGTKAEMRYWSDHYQGKEELKRENIFFPRDIWRNKRKLPPTELLTFIYYYPDEDCTKIYRPFGRAGKAAWYHERKWDSSLRFDYIENLSSLDRGCKRSFGLTSKKDRMVMMSATGITCAYNIQGENIHSISDSNLEHIRNHSKEQYIVGDRDSPGKAFSLLVCKELGYRHVNPPDDRPKDIAAWGLEYGLYEIDRHFKQKGLK